jgi:hypothetical protein
MVEGCAAGSASTFEEVNRELRAEAAQGFALLSRVRSASADNRMPGAPARDDVIETLRLINSRRNQIVHEADLVRTSRREPALRDISYAEAEEWIRWMRGLGNAIQSAVDDRV